MKSTPQVRTQLTQTRVSSKVFPEVEEFRVESWSRQDVNELVEDMGWNYQTEGNQNDFYINELNKQRV